MRKYRVVTLVLVVTGVMTSSLAFAQIQEELLAKPAKKSDKVDFFYKASNAYLLGATTFDMVSTAQVLNHPTVARGADGSVLTHYYATEFGWARCFGKRNTPAVVAGNVVLNAGIGYLSRRLYQRGGNWRFVAIGLNVFKGTDNLTAGIHNTRVNADQWVRQTTGYNGPIAWSH